MKIGLSLILIISWFFIFSQNDNKLNVDFAKHDITIEIDSNIWRLVSKEEYDDQNPYALSFLEDEEFIFYNGYIFKDSTNILLPPALMILGIKVPSYVNKDMIKNQASEIFSGASFLSTMIEQYKKETNDTPILLESLLGSDNFYNDSLDALITQIVEPGTEGEDNIILMATFVRFERLISIKLIYLKESQSDFLMIFTEIIEKVKIKE